MIFISSSFQKCEDLQFGGRIFYIAFHPLRICSYQEAILPICVVHSLILSHDNREFLSAKIHFEIFVPRLSILYPKIENFETISDLIK